MLCFLWMSHSENEGGSTLAAQKREWNRDHYYDLIATGASQFSFMMVVVRTTSIVTARVVVGLIWRRQLHTSTLLYFSFF